MLLEKIAINHSKLSPTHEYRGTLKVWGEASWNRGSCVDSARMAA